jgi:hypothetical protein
MAKKPSRKTAKKQPDPVVVRACIQTLREGLEQMIAMQQKVEDLIKLLDEPEGNSNNPKR